MPRPSLAPLLAAATLTACTGDPKAAGTRDLDPYTVAVFMPLLGASEQPDVTWTVDKVNRAGGVDGHPLEVTYVDIAELELEAKEALADTLLETTDVSAVLAGGGSDDLLELVPLFAEAGVPVLAPAETAGDLLRAFGGTTALWRTKLTDLVQVEFTLRELRKDEVGRVALWTSLDNGGQTWFDWFGFYAIDLGFDTSSLFIDTLSTTDDDCAAELAGLLAESPEVVIVAASTVDELSCATDAIIGQRDPDTGALPARMLWADLGIELALSFRPWGADVAGFEGWKGGSEASRAAAGDYAASSGNNVLPWNAEATHDALLLVAYGLARRDTVGGKLGDAIAEVVHGDGERTHWDDEGVADALSRVTAGELPNISGITGPLSYDPLLQVDLVAGALEHWTWEEVPGGAHGMVMGQILVVGEDGEGPPRMNDRASEDAYKPPPDLEGEFVPATAEPEAAKALIVSASSGWDNYRHQADALRRYQRLLDGGFSPDDIVMVGADDLVFDSENTLAGVVRNIPDGGDVYGGVVYDYAEAVDGDMLTSILLGEAADDTPVVLELDDRTNLYIYLVGHGGLFGVGFGADTAEAGYAGTGLSFWEPDQLTEALCTLRAAEGVRRVFIEVETCYAGVYGDADFWGIESGCDGGETPLEGVVMLTAAGTLENSLGAGWDTDLQQWVGDEFSVSVQERLDLGTTNLLDLYQETYLSVSGSHVGLYNSAYYGELSRLGVEEFLVSP